MTEYPFSDAAFPAASQARTRRLGVTLVWWLAAITAATSLLVWYSISLYNAMQTRAERADAEWQHVLTQYRRRADLVPNLVAVVKSYAGHETRLFTNVAAARAYAAATSAAIKTSSEGAAMKDFQDAQSRLSKSMLQLLAVAESHPQLKADTLYRDLMAQLEGTENRIAYSRQRHIEAVTAYNIDIRRFPGNLIARQYGFEGRGWLDDDNESLLKTLPKFDSQ